MCFDESGEDEQRHPLGVVTTATAPTPAYDARPVPRVLLRPPLGVRTLWSRKLSFSLTHTGADDILSGGNEDHRELQ